jgi:hypothetical protein
MVLEFLCLTKTVSPVLLILCVFSAWQVFIFCPVRSVTLFLADHMTMCITSFLCWQSHKEHTEMAALRLEIMWSSSIYGRVGDNLSAFVSTPLHASSKQWDWLSHSIDTVFDKETAEWVTRCFRSAHHNLLQMIYYILYQSHTGVSL